MSGRGQIKAARKQRPVKLPLLQPDAAHAIPLTDHPQVAHMVEQPLRMHDSPRAFSAGASVCIVNSEQFSAVLTVNQRLFLRPREPFNCCFALHGLALRVEHFTVRQRHRTASARVFCTFSAVVRRQSSREVVRPAAVQRIIRTAEHIGISFHRISFPLIGWPECHAAP